MTEVKRRGHQSSSAPISESVARGAVVARGEGCAARCSVTAEVIALHRAAQWWCRHHDTVTRTHASAAVRVPRLTPLYASSHIFSVPHHPSLHFPTDISPYCQSLCHLRCSYTRLLLPSPFHIGSHVWLNSWYRYNFWGYDLWVPHAIWSGIQCLRFLKQNNKHISPCSPVRHFNK